MLRKIFGRREHPLSLGKMERFTERSRRVLSLAMEEADRRQDGFVRSEYFLLALLREEGSIASTVLRDLGPKPDTMESVVLEMATPPQATGKTPELTPEVKYTLELAVDEARFLGNSFIGTEHLLMALTRQKDTIAFQVLVRLGMNPKQVRGRIHEVLKDASQTSLPRNRGINNRLFTHRAKLALKAAEDEAARLQQNQISPGHILIGLLSLEDSAAYQVLSELGVRIQQAQELVERRSHTRKRQSDSFDLSADTKHALRLAIEAAQSMNQIHIGTEHLLLGLLSQPDSDAAKILAEMKVNIAEAIRRIRTALLDGTLADVSLADKLAALFSADSAQTLHLHLAIMDKSDGAIKTQTTLSLQQLQEHLANLLGPAVLQGRRGKLLEFDTENERIEIVIDDEAE